MTDANTALLDAHLDAMDDDCPDCINTGDKDCPECNGQEPARFECEECYSSGFVPCDHTRDTTCAQDHAEGLADYRRDLQMDDER
jgi:hypothetical protein